MSTTERKIVYRIPLPGLRDVDVHKALEYFTERLGPPRHLEQWDGEVEYFCYGYDRYSGDNPTEAKEFFKPDYTRDNRWYVDLVLGHEIDDSRQSTYGLYPNMLHGAPIKTDGLNAIVEKHGFPTDGAYLCTYSWYNGVDEPFYLEGA